MPEWSVPAPLSPARDGERQPEQSQRWRRLQPDQLPSNPRHFEAIEGAKTRVSDMLLIKRVFDTLRVQALFHALFGVKTLTGTVLRTGATAFNENGLWG